ncbi:MAG: class I SAM-dependent methyltransferase [bacterium]
MSGLQSNLSIRMMALSFSIRDLFIPRLNILREAGITPESCLLDYGCGSGSYITPVANLVGPSGRVYALDIQPAAVAMVKGIVKRRGLKNITIIESDCDTGLPDNHLDVVLLYDVFHDLKQPERILAELHRVLKPTGKLSFSDHHLKEKEIVSSVSEGNYFRLTEQGKKTYTFAPTT